MNKKGRGIKERDNVIFRHQTIKHPVTKTDKNFYLHIGENIPAFPIYISILPNPLGNHCSVPPFASLKLYMFNFKRGFVQYIQCHIFYFFWVPVFKFYY